MHKDSDLIPSLPKSTYWLSSVYSFFPSPYTRLQFMRPSQYFLKALIFHALYCAVCSEGLSISTQETCSHFKDPSHISPPQGIFMCVIEKFLFFFYQFCLGIVTLSQHCHFVETCQLFVSLPVFLLIYELFQDRNHFQVLVDQYSALRNSPNTCSVQFSRSVVSDSLQPHGLQHARPPCPSPIPGVYPNS